MTGLGLGTWRDEPEYRAAMETLSTRGSFILRKLAEHDPVRFKTVMDSLCRNEPPTSRTSPSSSGRRSSPTWGPQTRRSAASRCGWGGRGGRGHRHSGLLLFVFGGTAKVR